jgi:hypothetical protein
VSICLVDTSILCEILQVPNLCGDHRSCTKDFRRKIEADERFLLPMATILETGNHIGQNGDGGERRKAAGRFIDLVTRAIEGTNPFTATPFVTPETLVLWLQEFEDWAKRSDSRGKGSGLGDLSIYHEWVHQCELHPKRRVYIWSKDAHLSSCDRAP